MTISATTQGIRPGVCTSTNRPANPFIGMVVYETDTGKMSVWTGSSWNGVNKVKKVAAFTSSGSWTVPAGVTYAVANIKGAGGGAGSSYGGAAVAGAGGSSSVAFASGTVTAVGGAKLDLPDLNQYFRGYAGSANTGQGAAFHAHYSGIAGYNLGGNAENGALITAGATVTPAASITVTVGSGGTAGGNGFAGGSGYVWIEYEE